MKNRQALAIAVSPTGAAKTRLDHPNLPLTPDEVAQTAADCLEVGACMLHLHVRRPDLSHSLEVEDYRTAMEAVHRKVGDRMVIQVTTEAGGKYAPARQIQTVKTLRPEAASIALREIAQGEDALPAAGEFFHWMCREHVVSQFILYSATDMERYLELRRRGVIPESRHWVLFVLGRYDLAGDSRPFDLLPLLEAWRNHADAPWMVCAFGRNEAACVTAALTLGGQARVGFENNVWLPDGSLAASNRDLVEVVGRIARTLDHPLATADTLRSWFE